MRITGDAVLPSYEHSKLKGCLVTGGAYGDISSERVYIRLEKMSCQRDGQLVEFTVDGHVSGNDGKPGIRGRVVMRDGALVGRAFVGGLFSGLGQAASDNYTDTSISPLGSTSTVKNGESYEYGAAQGFSNAANMYADYNIKRAEQYQPVIEVGAASQVDIVFANGFYLDGIDNKTHEKNRDNDLKNQDANVNQNLLARVIALENQDNTQDSNQAPSAYPNNNNNTGQADLQMPVSPGDV
jgi:conjugal transfer pilus assembly protein TraB